MAAMIFLVLGFILLIKGADLLVDGAASLARRLRVSDLVVGLTVVAFGTSAPELAVNILAAIRGTMEIAMGNIIGSNIANVLLILGISAAIYPLAVSRGTVWKEIPLSLLAGLLLAVLANDRGIDSQNFSALTRIDGLVLLAFFVIFLYYSFSIARQVEGMEEPAAGMPMGVLRAVSLIVLGLGGLILGGKWTVDNAVLIAQRFQVSTTLLGLTVVAVGTSLPEMATSVVAAVKKRPEIAIGNVVGSNIFNVFFILGVTATIRPIPLPARANLDLGVLILASLLLFILMFTGGRRRLDRWEGVLFIAVYIGYLIFIIQRG